VTGSAVAGGELRFGFAGLDEQIVMRVDAVRPPVAVGWSCVAHTRDEEWTGTELRFELADRGPRACELDFRHLGISPDVVGEGWDHFLASLAAYAEHGEGRPFGALWPVHALPERSHGAVRCRVVAARTRPQASDAASSQLVCPGRPEVHRQAQRWLGARFAGVLTRRRASVGQALTARRAWGSRSGPTASARSIGNPHSSSSTSSGRRSAQSPCPAHATGSR